MLRRRAAALKLKTEALASKARSWLHDKPGSLAWVPLASIANRYKFYLRQTMQIRMRRTGFAAMFLDATRRNLMGTNHLITKAALIANGVAMMLVYPLNNDGARTDLVDLGCSEPQSSARTHARRGLRDHGRIPDMGRARPRPFPPAHRLCHRFWGDTCDDDGGGRLVHAGNGGPPGLPGGRHRHLHCARDVSSHAPPALLSFRKRSNDVNPDGRAARFCARLVIVALVGGIMLELTHAIDR